jgi:hypothetical protein
MKPATPGLPLGGVCISCLFQACLRQVFGLAGYLLAPASQFMAEPVLSSERSFLLTAAGQFRIFTGFPFKPDPNNQAPESIASIYRHKRLRNPDWLWSLGSATSIAANLIR